MDSTEMGMRCLFSSDTLRFTYEDSEIARLEVPQILLSDDGELGHYWSMWRVLQYLLVP